MSILRTIALFVYLFGYMIVHYATLRRAERALAAGDLDTVEQIVKDNIPRWSRGILHVTGARMTVEGQKNIPAGPCVFVGNHRSYYDIPILLTALDAPHGILAMEELEKNPLLNLWMKLLGCVCVKRDDIRASVKALNDATAIVESGRSFVIFPEGTRYKGEEGGAGEFKAGAFRIAIKTGVPVVPVAISGARGLFEAHGNRTTPGTVRIRVLPPVQPAGMSRAEPQELPAAVEVSEHLFGGMPCQLGWCNGHNTYLNCLENHRDSEFNLGTEDFILLLAKMADITDGKLATAKVKAFRAPAGTLVEVYATTLHYAPCHVDPAKGFRVLVALPQGTNTAKPEIKADGGDDAQLWACNKWLLAHVESSEAAAGAYVGLEGVNIDIADDL